MSVNAINAADQQPQRKSSPIVPSLVAGTVLGGAGYGGGYYFSRKRPDLDAVFAMTPDTFKAETKEAPAELKEHVTTIENARTEYAKAGETERNAWHTEIKKRANLINSDAMKPDNFEELQRAITDKNATLSGKKVDVSETKKGVTYEAATNEVKTKRAAWMKAKADLAAASDADKAAKQTIVNQKLQELNQAKADRKTVYNGAKTEVDEAIKAKRDMVKARVAKFEAEAAKDGAAKDAKTAIANAANKFTEAKNTKLTELKGKKEIKTAFEKIQKLFSKKANGKTAWIAAGIAAAVGLIAGYILGGSKNDVA